MTSDPIPQKTLAEKLQEIRAGGFSIGDQVRVEFVADSRHGQVGEVAEIQYHGSWLIIVSFGGVNVCYAAEFLRHVQARSVK